MESYTVIIVFDSIAVTFKLKNKRKIDIYFFRIFYSYLIQLVARYCELSLTYMNICTYILFNSISNLNSDSQIDQHKKKNFFYNFSVFT